MVIWLLYVLLLGVTFYLVFDFIAHRQAKDTRLDSKVRSFVLQEQEENCEYIVCNNMIMICAMME